MTDNGGDLWRNEFNNFFRNCGIERKKTQGSYTPRQNGVAKGMNRMWMGNERSMLMMLGQDRNYRKGLWIFHVTWKIYHPNQHG